MDFTYYGHSCFLVKVNGKEILFDPFISENPLAAHIDIGNINPDYILLSHGHGDHVSDVEQIARQSDASIISTFEVTSWFEKKGLKGHPMNYGGKWSFDFGTVKMVNAVHSSSMPDGSYGGNPAGFVVDSDNGTFYYAGDTALHQDMKQIREEFNLSCAVLPIGDNFTMGIEDALKASDYVGTDTIIGVHYDTFPYIEIEKEKTQELADKANKKVILPEIGTSINL